MRLLHLTLLMAALMATLCAALAAEPGTPLTVFTADELSKHDGTDADLPLLLAVLGEVYDVSAGSKHYGKGKSYHAFVGRDGSRSFHTGDWKDARSDVADLTGEGLREVFFWRNFYRDHQEYRQVGVVADLYYDAAGQPTDYLREVEATQ
jgi:predicted heme/steroid binding protein